MTEIAHPYRTAPRRRDDAGRLSAADDVLCCLVALVALIAWAALRLAVSCVRGVDLETFIAVLAVTFGLRSYLHVRRGRDAVVRVRD